MAVRACRIVKNNNNTIDVIFSSTSREDLLNDTLAHKAMEELVKSGYSGYGIESISPVLPLDKKGKPITFNTGKAPVSFQRTIRFAPLGLF